MVYISAAPSHNLQCYHGKKNRDGDCECEPEFAGQLCERKKHCAGFERHFNYSCITCETGWTGQECDFIDCGTHGIPTSAIECQCTAPYSGPICDKLKTTDVYLYYNSKIYSMGPIGVLSIVPMIIILLGCKHLAEKRQVYRVTKALKKDHDIEPSQVRSFLKGY
ncbi:unnamed protein product [Bursaphelenchus okinawaensis]|uniref:EGF-like domain-containing protein n=1 Tax=Bursaphelenchus okinawaensis TaxID=465554 RepID=A0A811KGA6_9BILA|nr:unnamed protein product [Bursaphelenchus okinawaensis]CAG9102578.1 unnamed protein product [Bursaphelenchus okinawaensis]